MNKELGQILFLCLLVGSILNYQVKLIIGELLPRNENIKLRSKTASQKCIMLKIWSSLQLNVMYKVEHKN